MSFYVDLTAIRTTEVEHQNQQPTDQQGDGEQRGKATQGLVDVTVEHGTH